MENSAEQGEGRRKAGALQGRQRSYAKFYTADVKVFYQRIVLDRLFRNIARFCHFSDIIIRGIYNEDNQNKGEQAWTSALISAPAFQACA